MPAYQQLIIVGNCVADPELRYSASGVAIGSFRVAVNKSWVDRNTDEKREKVTYFRVTAWRALGETCNQFLRKGSPVMVIGEVEASAYENSDGPQASLEVTASSVQFLGSKRDEQEQPSGDSERLPF